MFVVLVHAFLLLLCGAVFGIALILFRLNRSWVSMIALFCGIALLPDRGFSSQLLAEALSVSASGGRWMFILLQLVCIPLGIVATSFTISRRA